MTRSLSIITSIIVCASIISSICFSSQLSTATEISGGYWIYQVDAKYDDLLAKADVSFRKLMDDYGWTRDPISGEMYLYQLYQSQGGELKIFRYNSHAYGKTIFQSFVMENNGSLYVGKTDGYQWIVPHQMQNYSDYLIMFYERYRHNPSVIVVVATGEKAGKNDKRLSEYDRPAIDIAPEMRDIYIVRANRSVLQPLKEKQPLARKDKSNFNSALLLEPLDSSRYLESDFFSIGYDHLLIGVFQQADCMALKDEVLKAALSDSRYMRSPIPSELQEYQLWNATFGLPTFAHLSGYTDIIEINRFELSDFITGTIEGEMIVAAEFRQRDGSYLIVLMRGKPMVKP